MDAPPPAIFPLEIFQLFRHEFRQLILMVRLLLSAALLATFAAPALGHMGMTIVKGGVKFPRDKAKGDAYRYPNYPMCHGVAKGASKITFNVNEAVQGRTSSGAGHNGGTCRAHAMRCR